MSDHVASKDRNASTDLDHGPLGPAKRLTAFGERAFKAGLNNETDLTPFIRVPARLQRLVAYMKEGAPPRRTVYTARRINACSGQSLTQGAPTPFPEDGEYCSFYSGEPVQTILARINYRSMVTINNKDILEHEWPRLEPAQYMFFEKSNTHCDTSQRALDLQSFGFSIGTAPLGAIITLLLAHHDNTGGVLLAGQRVVCRERLNGKRIGISQNEKGAIFVSAISNPESFPLFWKTAWMNLKP